MNDNRGRRFRPANVYRSLGSSTFSLPLWAFDLSEIGDIDIKAVTAWDSDGCVKVFTFSKPVPVQSTDSVSRPMAEMNGTEFRTSDDMADIIFLRAPIKRIYCDGHLGGL